MTATRLTKAGVEWYGFFASVVKCIRSWSPTQQEKETAYSRLLAEHLRIMLPRDSRVECEYRHAGETLDIYVRYNGLIFRDELFIELKRRLSSKAELNRLVGQVMGLNPKKHKLIMVLVGKSEPQLIGRLRDQFATELQGGFTFYDQPRMALVEVAEAETLES